VAGILIITGLILVLGWVAETRTDTPKELRFDPIGLGVGPEAAIRFLLIVGVTLAGLTALFLLAQYLLRRRAAVERILLALPGIGPTLRAMAMTRFCIAGRLMLETSLSIFKTIRLAFMATDNMAFISAYPTVDASVRQGNTLYTSFSKAGVFTDRFLSAIAIAEESGKLPEALRYLSDEYDDESRRGMAWLTRVASFVVWLAVATLIIVCVFSIFKQYIGMFDKIQNQR
jgi:type II secretory pathway component PulF